jgi:proline iminopeptidase
MLESYYRRLTDPDPAVHMPAAVALRTYSGWTVSFRPNEDYVREVAEPQAALTLARMFTHYCMNAMFVPEGALLAAVDRIRHLKGVIVQGRYDVVSPARSAFELAQALPNVELTIVNDGGHSIDEPDMARAMIVGQERLKALVG